MTAYTFDFFTRDGAFDTFDVGAFDSDGDAAREGRAALFSSITAAVVEVWTSSSRVAVIRREMAVG